MPRSNFQIALAVYGTAVRICLPRLRDNGSVEMCQIVADRWRDASHHGFRAVLAALMSEFFDLVRVGLRSLFRRDQLGTTGAPGPSPSRPRRSSSLVGDLRHAWRSLSSRRSAALLNFSLLALALSISATVFGVVDSLIVRPVPFPDPGRLVEIHSAAPGKPSEHSSLMPHSLVARWAERTDLFERVGAFMQAGTVILGDERQPELTAGAYFTPGTFEVFGIAPILGRTFAPGEGLPGADRLVVISESVWRTRLGGRRDAIGSRLLMNHAEYEVVGVMPDSFRFPYERQRIWMPYDAAQPPPLRSSGNVIARLRPEVALGAATAAVESAGPAIMAQLTQRWSYKSATLRDMESSSRRVDDRTRKSLWLLFGAAVVLLVTVCANVASVTTSQVFARTRDYAVQSALGASRFRLIRQSLAEHLLLGAAALAAALPLTAGGLRVVRSLLPQSLIFASINVIDLDLRVVVALAGIAVVIPVVAGLVPALAGSRVSLLEALKREGRSSFGTPGSRVFRKALVVIEIACAVLLLVAGSLLIRSFLRLQAVDKGFDTSRIASAYLLFPAPQFPTPLSRTLYTNRVIDRVKQLPGIESVAVASGLPPGAGSITEGRIEVDGQEPADMTIVFSYDVQPGFFDTFGIPLRSGRDFNPSDNPNIAIVSESFASRFWPGSSPIGQRFKFQHAQQWQQIVGVAGEIRGSDRDDALSKYEVYQYLPPLSMSDQTTTSTAPISGQRQMAIRLADPNASLKPIEDVFKSENSAVIINELSKIRDLYRRDLDRPRLLMAFMGVFAVASLILAAAGVYGVLAGLVAQQHREISVRLMLGAEPAKISRAIVRNGFALAAIGALIGLVSAMLASRTISSILFEIQPWDVTSYVVVAPLLLLTALLASWWPSRRAMRIDPAALLREE